jgi:hypothetical protein
MLDRIKNFFYGKQQIITNRPRSRRHSKFIDRDYNMMLYNDAIKREIEIRRRKRNMQIYILRFLIFLLILYQFV